MGRARGFAGSAQGPCGEVGPGAGTSAAVSAGQHAAGLVAGVVGHGCVAEVLGQPFGRGCDLDDARVDEESADWRRGRERQGRRG